MNCNNYGIKKGQKLNTQKVRDIMVDCFKKAHKKEFEEMKEYGHFETEDEFEKFKKIDVELLIKKSIQANNGDFDNPTKEDLEYVVEDLKEFALHFRDEKIVINHAIMIKELINKI